MKACVVTCFESNEERVAFVADTLKRKGFDVMIITSDFSHLKKTGRNNIPSSYCAIPTRPYKKNLSLARILSHLRFAKDAFIKIKEADPDLIWLMAPANSLIKEAERYRRDSRKAKLIIDIIDMWPESLPVSFNKNLFPLNIWRNIRKNHISCADALVCECDLYREILEQEYDKTITTIHWVKDHDAVIKKPDPDNDRLSLVYIGSINNIIDAERIAEVISKITMPVVLHVIGEGENTENFLKLTEQVCEVIYHGPVRDEETKSEIFSLCHAGVNIYKEGLYIGLTVKCIDYFSHDLPIINNIKGDTWNLVETYDAGINLSQDTAVDGAELIALRRHPEKIEALYRDHFTKEVFYKKCAQVIDEVMR